MKITIFDVQHGFCALAESGGYSMMFDCGCGPAFTPSAHLLERGRGVDELVISHPHQDHLSDLPAILTHRLADVILYNATVPIKPPRQPSLLDPGPGRSVAAFQRFRKVAAPAMSNSVRFHDAEVRMFCLRYSAVRNENDSSIVSFICTPTFGIVFPGDLEASGWKLLMQDPTFRWYLKQTTFFVASHHGRSNGHLPDIFDFCRPEVVVISDAAKRFRSQGVDYGCRAVGRQVGGQLRRTLTTRRDGTIFIETFPWGPEVRTERSRRESLLGLLSTVSTRA